MWPPPSPWKAPSSLPLPADSGWAGLGRDMPALLPMLTMWLPPPPSLFSSLSIPLPPAQPPALVYLVEQGEGSFERRRRRGQAPAVAPSQAVWTIRRMEMGA